jgi:hypothetical protein
MPVILTTADEVETWMTASLDEAMKLQRPLSDGALKIVARGVKEDSVLRALPLNYLDADDETNRWNGLADSEREIFRDCLGVNVSAKHMIPNREKRCKIPSVMLRIIAVVNVMISRRYKDPLDPSIAPSQI